MKDAQLPEYMQGGQQTETDKSATPSLNYLSGTTTGKFIKKQGDTEVDLGTEVEIVILAISPPKNFVNERAYWPGAFGESEGSPECASSDSVKPYGWLENPQAESCGRCKWGIAGSKIGAKGKGQQCSSFKMIYFVYADSIKDGVCAYKVPITSLKQLSAYRWDIKQLGAPIAGVITKVSYDPDCTDYSKPRFDFVGFLNKSEFEFSTKLAVSAEVIQLQNKNASNKMIEENVSTQRIVQSGLTAAEAAKLNVNHITDIVEPTAEDIAKGVLSRGLEETEDLIDVNSFFDEEPTVKTFYEEVLEELPKHTANLNEFLQSLDRNKLSLMTTEEKNNLKKLVQELTSQPKSEPAFRITDIVRTSQLPTALEVLRSRSTNFDSEDGQRFVKRAGKLNNESWTPEKHSTSKDGYPAFTKDGNFKRRRGLTTAVESRSSTDENNSELDDLLGVLEEI